MYFHPVILKRKLLLGTLMLGMATASAALRLPAIFSDHMVLQRSKQTAIWGWATPGQEVCVTIGQLVGSARADQSGRWQIALNLETLPTGGSYQMTVSGETVIQINDVAIGQVWLASGQSNMFWPLRNSIGGDEEIRNGAGKGIREFQVALAGSTDPQQDLEGKWVVAEPGQAKNFSAVAYFFAKRLHAELRQPVGIIHSSWGGSSLEAWASAEALAVDPELKASFDSKTETILAFDAARADFANALNTWICANGLEDKAFAPTANYLADAIDTADWAPVHLSDAITTGDPLPKMGVIWLRRNVDVPAEAAGKDLIYHIREGHGFATFYWNGYRFQGPEQWSADELGKTKGQGHYSRVVIPGVYVKEGNNTVAIRCYLPLPAPDSFGWRNSVEGEAGFSRGLDDGWLARAETRFLANATPPAIAPLWALEEVRHRPSHLYNAMIAPLEPYSIAGVIWYQGESNVERAVQYRHAFTLLIEDWRKRRNAPRLPFYFCQLANYGAISDTPQESAWAELREAQTLALRLPATGQAVLIDIGEADDIHPRNKADVGERLARLALANDYGLENLVCSGPVYKKQEIVGNAILLTFKDDGPGSELIARPLQNTYLKRTLPGPQTAPLHPPVAGSQLQGFAICGDDGVWVWAQASIEGTHRVAVWSDEVPEPAHVRYAWAANPVCNLYNAAGLPAVPFRTDNFTPITINGRF